MIVAVAGRAADSLGRAAAATAPVTEGGWARRAWWWSPHRRPRATTLVSPRSRCLLSTSCAP